MDVARDQAEREGLLLIAISCERVKAFVDVDAGRTCQARQCKSCRDNCRLSIWTDLDVIRLRNRDEAAAKR